MNLETERLLLRPHEPGDMEAFHELMSDPEVTRFSPVLPLSFEHSQDLLNRIVESRTQSDPETLPHNFVITLRESGLMIGTCRLGLDKEKTDIVYALRRAFWGQGYATEAVRALIQYGFEKRGLEHIFGVCNPENIASRRVMEKAGMKEDGLIHRYAAEGNFSQGEFCDQTFCRFIVKRSDND